MKMSPRKEPQMLFHICRNVLSTKIIDICREYESSNEFDDCYVQQCHEHNVSEPNKQFCEKFTCPDGLAQLQKYLLDNLPNDIFDDLCNVVLNEFSVSCSAIRIHDSVFRVLLMFFMHENMCYFDPNIRLPPDDNFWVNKLCCLQKLVVLNLNRVCTDEILKVVGAHCLLLEVINITSKTASYDCDERRCTINALKLRYFISDKGLEHLSNCKKLRKIVMNRISKTQFAGRMITQNGIKELVKSLPSLAFINYREMGSVVNELHSEFWTHPLSLVHMDDYDCWESHIKSISALCPNLNSLCLSRHVLTQYLHIETQDNILISLCASHLKLQSLFLKSWLFTENLTSYFKLKGHHLHTLLLECRNPISSNILILIGQYCPNLERLHINNVTADEYGVKNLHPSENSGFMKSLVTLNLYGNNWPPQVCLTVCVRYATKLKALRLSRGELGSNIDNHLLNLMKYNSFSELSILYLGKGCIVTRDLLYELIAHCKNLKILEVRDHNLQRNEKNELYSYIKSNNLNLSVYFNVFGGIPPDCDFLNS